MLRCLFVCVFAVCCWFQTRIACKINPKKKTPSHSSPPYHLNTPQISPPHNPWLRSLRQQTPQERQQQHLHQHQHLRLQLRLSLHQQLHLKLQLCPSLHLHQQRWQLRPCLHLKQQQQHLLHLHRQLPTQRLSRLHAAMTSETKIAIRVVNSLGCVHKRC